ncbi:MAG: hypothetical protein GY906_40425 [bacterium]|nr:hypothetical protein [bacterium]
MGTIHLPPDFKEFLRCLRGHSVRYLLVGGYAVGYHGYPRATMNIDVWIARNQKNAQRVVTALETFGFGGDTLDESLFLESDRVIRMGLPPMRIEILTEISGVEFDEAYSHRVQDQLDGVDVDLISLHHLKINKVAAGRAKDLADLEELP